MRRAGLMKLKPGQEAAYKKKHDETSPEMVALLKQRRIRNDTIYRKTNADSSPVVEPLEAVVRLN